MGENNDHAKVSIVWTSKTMKNVSHNLVNVKLMQDPEIDEFKRAVRARLITPDSLMHIDRQLNWVKMLKVNDLTDTSYEETVGGFTRDNQLKVKKTVKMLLDETKWFDLGKVAAVDLFNGNNDRFDREGYWVNKGNIMFVNNVVIGMDTWDPSGTNAGGGFSNLAVGGGYEELRILIDPALMRQYAHNITSNVGIELGRALARTEATAFTIIVNGQRFQADSTSIRTLYLDYATNFQQGLAAGAQQLRVYLQGKVRQYQNPWQRVGGHQGNRANGFNMGQQRRAQRAFPQMGQRRVAPIRGQQAPPPPQPVVPPPPPVVNAQKQIPQGVLDRMTYLGWL